MEDSQIIDLYWQRNETAIAETETKYGTVCHAVSYGIVKNYEDAQECVNDTWVRTWNAIPPQRPTYLKAFLVKIVRNLSLNRLEMQNARKRGGGEMEIFLDELSECVAGPGNVEDDILEKELGEQISIFLNALPERSRGIFTRRYFYFNSVNSIAKRYGMKESAVLMDLSRTRKKLKNYLEVKYGD